MEFNSNTRQNQQAPQPYNLPRPYIYNVLPINSSQSSNSNAASSVNAEDNNGSVSSSANSNIQLNNEANTNGVNNGVNANIGVGIEGDMKINKDRNRDANSPYSNYNR